MDNSIEGSSTGSNENDSILNWDDNVYIRGGDDLIVPRECNVMVYGREGDDTIINCGKTDNDTFCVGDDNIKICGGTYNDTFYGVNGNIIKICDGADNDNFCDFNGSQRHRRYPHCRQKQDNFARRTEQFAQYRRHIRRRK